MGRVLENGFRTRWNFPGCYRAIDGKYVSIQVPNLCGSEFWNYKGNNSIVLMAIVDHDYCFRYINVEANGRNSDEGIFRNCSIYQKLENNNILLDGGFFVEDDAFPLKTYLLKPYSHKCLTYDEKIFNYRLSRARRIVENAFGVLASRFRIFHKPISTCLEVTDKIIRTACTLHNWLRMTSGITYLGSGTVDVEDENIGEIYESIWRREFFMPSISNTGLNHSARQARELRERYIHYFTHEGAVPW